MSDCLFEELNRTDSDGRYLYTAFKGHDRSYWIAPSHPDKNRVPQEIPPDTVELRLITGGAVAELSRALALSDWPERLTGLFLGGASESPPSLSMDYREAVSILSKALYPRLKTLTLGGWWLFSNSHCGFGKLGNVADMIKGCPELMDLELCGNFELNGYSGHPGLEKLRIQANDMTTCINGGEISQETLDNLLSGDYPRLRELELDLEMCDNGIQYRLPDRFLTGEGVPLLNNFQTVGHYSDEETARQLSSAMAAREVYVVYKSRESST